MKILTSALVSLTFSWHAIAVSPTPIPNPNPNPTPVPKRGFLPAKIGDVNVAEGKSLNRTGIVVDDKGTVFLLSMLANGENRLMRMSRRGLASELVMYRGWPYILDKKGNLWALDISYGATIRNKLPYMTMRALKTIPIAIGAGLGVYGLALLDRSFTGVVSVENYTPSDAFWGGLLLFYGLDFAHSVLFTRHRVIKGGDFFTKQIASNVSEFGVDPNYEDYRVVYKSKNAGNTVTFLSVLSPNRAGKYTCIDYLTKLNLR